ncbi:MAG: GFA family protein [Methyloceanibacter sp.]
MTSPSLSPQSAQFWLEEGRAGRKKRAAMRWKQGGCHCGAVRFAVLAPDAIEAVQCNCSICRITGFLHLIVPKDRFRLLAGQDRLTTYSFNTGTAKHLFCSVCGVKSFYVPRSHPDGFSVNVRCLDDGTVEVAKVTTFDGQHWEDARARMGD